MSILSEVGKNALETGTSLSAKGGEFPNPWERPEGAESGLKNEVGTPELQPKKTEFPNPWERPEGAAKVDNIEVSEVSPRWQNPDGTPNLSEGGFLDNIAQELNKRNIEPPLDFDIEEDGRYDADGIPNYSEEKLKDDWYAEDVYDTYFRGYDENPEFVKLEDKIKELSNLLNDNPDLSKGSAMDNLAQELNKRDLPSPYNETPVHWNKNGEVEFSWEAEDVYNDFGRDFVEHPEFPDKDGNFPKGGKVENLTNLLNSRLNEGENSLTAKEVYNRFLEPLTEKSPVVAKLDEILNA